MQTEALGPGSGLRVCILHFAFCIPLSCAKASPTATPSPATARTAIAQLATRHHSATQGPGVQRGVWGIAVHSLDRNERLFELQAASAARPGLRGEDRRRSRPRQKLSAGTTSSKRRSAPRGSITDGVLRGDLLVVGSGDPTDRWPRRRGSVDVGGGVEGAGIRRIEGRIIGDDDAIEEPRPQLAWAWDDLGYPTGAIFGALNYAENRMT